MMEITDDNLIGFYASFQAHDKDRELMKAYLWGENGLKNKLRSLKWQTYGQDFHLILFEFYVKPIPLLRENLRAIENYSKKEKAIGIPIIIDEDNFFKLNETDKDKFILVTIQNKLDLLKEKIKRNKLDLDLSRLKNDVEVLLTVKNK